MASATSLVSLYCRDAHGLEQEGAAYLLACEYQVRAGAMSASGRKQPWARHSSNRPEADLNAQRNDHPTE
jgi:hypothetical protein